MHITTLRTFLTILEAGSLVRASERLNVSQSTVTARLKALEEDLGHRLVNRHKSGVTPTASGLRLKRYAETMTELWRQARQETALPTSVRAVCNIGCHADLWPGLGQALFDRIRTREATVALSVWHGGQGDLAAWQSRGLTEICLTYWPGAWERQSVRPLPADRLVLVSTRADAPVRHDPGYVYVEAGDAFGRAHAVAYADADTARISFGSAGLALGQILAHGGSAYLPERIAAPHIVAGRLHRLDGAPAFERDAWLVTNDTATAGWGWLGPCLDDLLRGRA